MSDAPEGPADWHLTATPEESGTRLDRFLAGRIGSLSRTRVKALVGEGHATAAGRLATDPAATVQPGAAYTLHVPAARTADPQPQSIALNVLFEDCDLIVLDKPAGLVVHPAPGNPDGTLVNALLAHCGETLNGIGGEKRPGIVHRLDKNTSGLMVAAKSDLAMSALSAAFAARDLERAYVALCWGIPAPTAGELDGAIGRDPKERKRMAVVTRGGKPALTRYRLRQAWYGAVSLVECRLATGRTHQIRVHLATAGHPIVGDPVYLRRVPAVSRLVPLPLRECLTSFSRQALHAAVLGFRHPRTHQELRFESPPPADFTTLLHQLDAHQG